MKKGSLIIIWGLYRAQTTAVNLTKKMISNSQGNDW